MSNRQICGRAMIFLQTFILYVIHKITISEGLIFKDKFESVNFGFEKIPLAPTVISDKFSQKLDHFNPTDVRTWKQVYFYEKSYYKSGGPAYLFIGGESRANPKRFEVGYWQSHGKSNKAMLFLLEHRFYGDSQPLGTTTTEHLSYLTTEQALADLATFIVSMSKLHKFPAGTKWIIFGGSYGGNLAAWMRTKYPHVVHAAVSSSAPVLAQFDFPEYLEVVSNALASYKKQCQNDIAIANHRLDKMVQTIKGRKRIGRIFKLCSPLSDRDMDKSFWLGNMADYLAATVQYDNFGKHIKEACDKMLEKSTKTNQVRRYSNLMNFLSNKYGESCLPTNFTEFVEYIKQVDSQTSTKSFRSWWYQTCTEYGYYQTTTNSTKTFSKHITLGYFIEWCTNAFKNSFTKEFISQAVDNTNKFFGGLKLNVDRLVFIHGEWDPWHVLGITGTNKWSNFETIFVKGASHCSDLRLPSDNDNNDVKTARTKVTNLLDKWLKVKQ